MRPLWPISCNPRSPLGGLTATGLTAQQEPARFTRKWGLNNRKVPLTRREMKPPVAVGRNCVGLFLTHDPGVMSDSPGLIPRRDRLPGYQTPENDSLGFTTPALKKLWDDGNNLLHYQEDTDTGTGTYLKWMLSRKINFFLPWISSIKGSLPWISSIKGSWVKEVKYWTMLKLMILFKTWRFSLLKNLDVII